jgi:hypothetical protein
MKRVWILVTVFLGSLLLLSNLAPALAGNPSFFAPITEPIGIAASRYALLVTHPYNTNPREILSIDDLGHVTLFATLPDRVSTDLPSEELIAISPGLGGFPAGYVYVTQGKNIIQVSPSGSSVTLFATIPSLPPSHNGITFDHVGSFGYDMIVPAGTADHSTGASGEIWRINSAGVATLVTTLPGCPGTTCPILEGVEVAPLSFAPYGGQIIVTSENTGNVWAVSASGVVTPITTLPAWGPEDVRFIPFDPCNFGRSGGMYFDDMYTANAVWKYPQSDFVGLGGSALITDEDAGTIVLMTSTGGGITFTTFQTGLPGLQEDSTIVDCTVPPPVPVGGAVHAVNSFELLSPWLAVIGLVGCIGTTAVVVRKRRP